MESLIPDEIRVQKLTDLEYVMDGIRCIFGNFSVRRGNTLVDTKLSNLDPKKDHTIHCRLSNAIYAGTGFQVDTVLCNGKVLLKNKCFTCCDAAKILAKGGQLIIDIFKRL